MNFLTKASKLKTRECEDYYFLYIDDKFQNQFSMCIGVCGYIYLQTFLIAAAD
jgi:hypothetical protein